MDTKEKPSCLRCGDEYEMDPITHHISYDDHICHFDENKEEKEQIIKTGVIGKPRLDLRDIIHFKNTFFHIYAMATYEKQSKRYLMGFNHQYKVMYNQDIVYEGRNMVEAAGIYNLIDLKDV